MIQSVRYMRAPPATTVAVEIDGKVWTTDTALPPNTRVRAALAAWLAAGNTPEPYVPPAVPRIVSGTAFLALWTPTEISAAFAADPRLLAGALKVAAQDSANMDSAECAALLALAEAKGVLTAERRARIAAAQPPA
jgi:hypothetical protein